MSAPQPTNTTSKIVTSTEATGLMGRLGSVSEVVSHDPLACNPGTSSCRRPAGCSRRPTPKEQGDSGAQADRASFSGNSEQVGPGGFVPRGPQTHVWPAGPAIARMSHRFTHSLASPNPRRWRAHVLSKLKDAQPTGGASGLLGCKLRLQLADFQRGQCGRLGCRHSSATPPGSLAALLYLSR